MGSYANICNAGYSCFFFPARKEYLRVKIARTEYIGDYKEYLSVFDRANLLEYLVDVRVDQSTKIFIKRHLESSGT
ncbi:hypothetical protein FMO003_25940 [Moritella sp. F3]|nr:hypothetical protein FMO001_19210 [Moritella sp. F1]GIC82313.1 hypothetical protein FMO003_25940 [Moritella sp. F3]